MRNFSRIKCLCFKHHSFSKSRCACFQLSFYCKTLMLHNSYHGHLGLTWRQLTLYSCIYNSISKANMLGLTCGKLRKTYIVFSMNCIISTIIQIKNRSRFEDWLNQPINIKIEIFDEKLVKNLFSEKQPQQFNSLIHTHSFKAVLR